MARRRVDSAIADFSLYLKMPLVSLASACSPTGWL